MNIGTIYLTSDEGLMYQNAMNPSVKLVLLGSKDQNSPQIQNMVSASTLTPSYSALQEILDGDINRGHGMYYQELYAKDPRSTMSIFITCILRGFNVIIYCPQQERELFCHVLEHFLATEIGIVIGTEQRQFSMNPDAKWIVDSWLYEFELLDAKTFLTNFPKGYKIPDNCLERLMNEFNPYLPNATKDVVSKYFYDLKESIIESNQYLINPFVNARV